MLFSSCPFLLILLLQVPDRLLPGLPQRSGTHLVSRRRLDGLPRLLEHAAGAAARRLDPWRSGALLLDFLRLGLPTRTDDNYWDDIHYRGAVAALGERSISAVITGASEVGSDIVAGTRGTPPG
ncbi:MAG TPA: hypothetical protein VMU42_06600 [Candidatus Sulfotelmatobacter sp.]|nr:hypothetical protein [Candidatus Sulfotelmatobacter sp.]